jgi:plasmid stabilization system protein ParE
MARLKIVWTKTAYRQRNSIFKYWNDRNKSNNYSKKLLKEINSRTLQISNFPESGKKVDCKNTRAVSLGHFSIFYQHIGNSIIITGFWDNRDDPSKLLSFLKE